MVKAAAPAAAPATGPGVYSATYSGVSIPYQWYTSLGCALRLTCVLGDRFPSTSSNSASTSKSMLCEGDRMTGLTLPISSRPRASTNLHVPEFSSERSKKTFTRKSKVVMANTKAPGSPWSRVNSWHSVTTHTKSFGLSSSSHRGTRALRQHHDMLANRRRPRQKLHPRGLPGSLLPDSQTSRLPVNN